MFYFEGTWNDVGATLDIFSPNTPNLRRFVIEFSVPEPSSLLASLCCVVVFGRVRRPGMKMPVTKGGLSDRKC